MMLSNDLKDMYLEQLLEQTRPDGCLIEWMAKCVAEDIDRSIIEKAITPKLLRLAFDGPWYKRLFKKSSPKNYNELAAEMRRVLIEHTKRARENAPKVEWKGHVVAGPLPKEWPDPVITKIRGAAAEEEAQE
jgi:hypothetical protein